MCVYAFLIASSPCRFRSNSSGFTWKPLFCGQVIGRKVLVLSLPIRPWTFSGKLHYRLWVSTVPCFLLFSFFVFAMPRGIFLSCLKANLLFPCRFYQKGGLCLVDRSESRWARMRVSEKNHIVPSVYFVK